MKNFFAWFEESKIRPDEPWLILGKGPSYARRGQYDTKRFRTFSLNHVAREQPVDVAHMIDCDVVDDCGEAVLDNATVLVMPWIPHVRNKPGTKRLTEWVTENPILRQMDAQGRLLWYNLRTGWEQRGTTPVVGVWYFSSEAALNLLATAGARTVRSLGVDGGAAYSSDFGDLTRSTLLNNKQSSFDVQFREIAKILHRTGIDYAPLDLESPIRVYVAATEAQMLPVRVLEHSIRKHTSMTVSVFPLHRSDIHIPVPDKESNRPRTPFSFQRFLIPECARFAGRAIYMDSDMQVFRDVRDLWSIPFEGADLLAVKGDSRSGRIPQFSVMLLDCARLRWDIRSIVGDLNTGKLSYEDLMYRMAVAGNVRADIPSAWNSLETYREGETALIHYTDMETQPWVSARNPRGYLWVRELIEAIGNGHISLDEVREHVRLKHVRPSLLYQVETGLEDPLLLPGGASQLDEAFSQPFQSEFRHASPWAGPIPKMRALARRAYRNSTVDRIVRRLRKHT